MNTEAQAEASHATGPPPSRSRVRALTSRAGGDRDSSSKNRGAEINMASPFNPMAGLAKNSLVGDGSFGKADRYDAGISPGVAVNATNTVVEVHQSQNAGTLW